MTCGPLPMARPSANCLPSRASSCAPPSWARAATSCTIPITKLAAKFIDLMPGWRQPGPHVAIVPGWPDLGAHCWPRAPSSSKSPARARRDQAVDAGPRLRVDGRHLYRRGRSWTTARHGLLMKRKNNLSKDFGCPILGRRAWTHAPKQTVAFGALVLDVGSTRTGDDAGAGDVARADGAGVSLVGHIEAQKRESVRVIVAGLRRTEISTVLAGLFGFTLFRIQGLETTTFRWLPTCVSIT